MTMTRGNPPPPRTTKLLHVVPVKTKFGEATPAAPRFVRRSPVPEEQPFIRPPTKAQLMARR